MHVVLNTSTIGPHSGSYASPDIQPFSGLFPHTLRMFSVSLFRLRLAPFFSFPLVSFAIELRPLPLLSTSCPLSRLDITSTAIFILNTGLVSHTTRPNFSPFVCVRFRATVAHSPTCLLPRSRFLVSLAVRSDFTYRHSSPSSANLCVPPPRCRLTLAFRSSRAHRPLITPACVLSSGTCPVFFIFSVLLSNSRADLPPPFSTVPIFSGSLIPVDGLPKSPYSTVLEEPTPQLTRKNPISRPEHIDVSALVPWDLLLL